MFFYDINLCNKVKKYYFFYIFHNKLVKMQELWYNSYIILQLKEMKKLKRAIFTILLSLSLITSVSFAASLPFNGNNLLANINDEKVTAGWLVGRMDAGVGPGIKSLLSVLYAFGLVACVGVFAYMAVQVIISPPEKKAQIKAGLTPYFIGLLLLVAGVPIAIAIINIFVDIF